MKIRAEFFTDDETTVIYRGAKGYLEWEKHGLFLFFEKSYLHSEEDEYHIQVSAGEDRAFRYPDGVEQASQIFCIESSKPLNTSVTVRIQHDVAVKDMKYLCFVTCSDKEPPYDYTILHNSHFETNYGEVVVQKFSLYALGLQKRYCVRGVLALMERSYSVLLYHSEDPKFTYPKFTWNVYVSVIKDCKTFRNSVKEFIKDEYEEKVSKYEKATCRFTKDKNFVTACLEENIRNKISLTPSEHSSIRKIDISSYVDGRPPLMKYFLQTNIHGEKININLNLKGLHVTKPVCLSLTVPECKECKNYSISLYHSIDPKVTSSMYTWNIYVSAMKSCLDNPAGKLIQDEYDERLKLASKITACFTNNEDFVTTFAHFEENEVSLNSSGNLSMKKTDISSYVYGCPPLIKYILQSKTTFHGKQISIKFGLQGLQEPKNFMLLHLSVPKCKNAIII